MDAPAAGHASLAVAIVAAALAALAPLVARRSRTLDARRPPASVARWAAIAPRALALSALALVVAVATLSRAIVRLDYRLAYVADVANRGASRPYRLAGLWAQMAGSLLLFAALAGVAAWWGVWLARRNAPALVPMVTAFGALVTGGLAVASRVAADPFAVLAQPAIDGAGLTPILEHWAMLVHPPLLYASVVLTVPLAALAVASWSTGVNDDASFVGAARTVAVVAWTVLTLALTLGGRWAYAEVGWGGFWAWDPVENGGLLVWLALLVVVHAARRRGTAAGTGHAVARAAWSAFALAVAGVLVTRSGAAASVHAFGQAARVGHALAVLATIVAAVSGAAWWRGRRRRALHEQPAAVAVAADRLLAWQQVATVVAMVVVLLGTLYPVVARWIDGRRRVVDARYYTAATAPLAAVAVVAMTIALWRAPRSRASVAMLLAHAGMLVFVAGSLATSLGSDRSATVTPGSTVTVAGHALTIGTPSTVAHDRYQRIAVPVTMRDGRSVVAQLLPALRVYESAGVVLPETALHSSVAGDVQLSVRKVDERGDVTLDIHVRPVAWAVWFGALMMVAGGAAAVVSRRHAGTRVAAAALVLAGCTATTSSTPKTSTESLAPTPPMGWNNWARFACDGLNEALVLRQADALVASGMAAAGYRTVTLDDCWMLPGRDQRGRLVVDRERFPRGMVALADDIRRRGLHFGIYANAGTTTCAGHAGSFGHERDDARLFASWGAEYVKYDGCNVPGGSVDDYRRAFGAMRAALDATGRRVVMNSIVPLYFTPTEAAWYESLSISAASGQQWRTSRDIPLTELGVGEQWPGVLFNYDTTIGIGRYSGPATGWNDADMLIVGNGLTDDEARTHMSLWAMMASPLIASTDVTALSPGAIATLTNRDVIAIDQDRAGIAAARVSADGAVDVLVRPLDGGDRAVALVNRSDAPVERTWSAALTGFTAPSCSWTVRDVWHATTATTAANTDEWTVTITPHATALYRITPASGCDAAVARGQITNADGTCLTAAGAAGGDRASVGLGRCDGRAAQQWDRMPSGAIASEGRCLSTMPGDATRGAVLSSCGSDAAQRWTYDRDGALTNAASRACLARSSDGANSSMTSVTCQRFDPTQVWSLPA